MNGTFLVRIEQSDETSSLLRIMIKHHVLAKQSETLIL